MIAFRRSLLALPLLLLLGWSWWQLHRPPSPLPTADGSTLTWSECWFDSPWWRPVHCGWLQVPDGFRLPVVYLPAWFWRRHAPPVIYVNGGPGAATGLDDEVMPAWLDWVDEVAWPSDLILYDQRGVGLSRPAFDCPEVRAVRKVLMASTAPLEAQYRRLAEVQHRCLARLRASGFDPQRFHSLANADDVLSLVGALGLPRWRLYGVSYGTRVVLELMRRNPPGLEAVVLDSVYPPEVHAEEQDAWLLQRALVQATRVCELLDCELGRARLRQWLEQAMAGMEARSLQLSLMDPEEKTPIAARFDAADMAWLVFDAQYDWHKLLQLPALLRELAERRPGKVTFAIAQDALAAELADDVSDPVANSVECADNGSLQEQEFLRQLQQFPLVAEIKRLDWRFGPCRWWPHAPVAQRLRRPLVSAVPTLLLAGEFDPVTPPEWAERTAAQLPEGNLLIFAGMGHGVLDSDDCAVAATRAFWRDPAAPQVPACLDP
ncbi:MAG: alpha/beta hydrolase [Gammaproteobacteria bacterium]|nr:MAG: alpha/beta hydrolase [Gammaproteobacteria bacterium]